MALGEWTTWPTNVSCARKLPMRRPSTSGRTGVLNLGASFTRTNTPGSTTEANKATYIRKARKSDAIRNERYNALKDVPCADCGESYPPWVMDFDHLGDKVFAIGGSQRGIQAVTEEAKKCDVVCSNCHRQRTHDRLTCPSGSMDQSA